MSIHTTTQDLNTQHVASHVGPLRRAFREVQNASVEMDRMNRPWAYQGRGAGAAARASR